MTGQGRTLNTYSDIGLINHIRYCFIELEHCWLKRWGAMNKRPCKGSVKSDKVKKIMDYKINGYERSIQDSFNILTERNIPYEWYHCLVRNNITLDPYWSNRYGMVDYVIIFPKYYDKNSRFYKSFSSMIDRLNNGLGNNGVCYKKGYVTMYGDYDFRIHIRKCPLRRKAK